MGDLHRFRIGQMQGLLNPFRFIIFQVENDLCLAVVDDTFAKATFIQIEEIVEVLAREDRRASKNSTWVKIPWNGKTLLLTIWL